MFSFTYVASLIGNHRETKWNDAQKLIVRKPFSAHPSISSRFSVRVVFGINYTLLPYQKRVRSRAILRCTHPNAKCIIARLFKTCADNYRICYKTNMFSFTYVASFIRNHRETKWNDAQKLIVKNIFYGVQELYRNAHGRVQARAHRQRDPDAAAL